MKTFLVAALLTCLLPLAPVTLVAQSEPIDRRIPELEFSGIPMNEAARYLRQEFKPINIIVSSRVADIPLTLKLVDVNLEGILEAMELATENKVEAVQVHERLIHFKPGEFGSTGREPVTRVFNLKSYLSGLEESKVENAMTDVEEVVQITWEATQTARRAMGMQTDQVVNRTAVRFHRGTQLLIVSGPPEYVNVYGQVVDQLVHEYPQSYPQSGYGGTYGGRGGYGEAGGMDARGRVGGLIDNRRSGFGGGFGTGARHGVGARGSTNNEENFKGSGGGQIRPVEKNSEAKADPKQP